MDNDKPIVIQIISHQNLIYGLTDWGELMVWNPETNKFTEAK